ncbi:MAG: hypothetical protein HY337_00265 [Gemmatimonadetes bacterium]|nr:hypothetical protein [Gemmatimonadota bacterium]
MNEIMRKRVLRILENLPDETAYQVLDYLEFLESKHGTGAKNASPLQRLAEGVEDTLRATRVPAAAIRGTMNVVDAAARLMDGLASAGRAAVEELGKTAAPGPPAASGPPEAPRDEPRAEDPPAA